MFRKLRNRIVIITVVITTAVLILAGSFIMLFSSVMRPEPKPRLESISTNTNGQNQDFENLSNATKKYDSQDLTIYIKTDRKEGNERLLISLLCTGAVVETAVFLVSWYLSKKIVEPVKDSYNKQKLFIANASHELKTPLAVIQANIEALEVDKKDQKWKKNIEDEITHANKLVLDLLQLAKMDAGDIKKNSPEKINLNAEINKRIKIFRPKFSGDISMETKAKAKCCFLPKQDFVQVLDILLDNATKYGDKKISVVVDKNSVSIVNDGVSISKSDTKKVFDRFYQTDKTKEGSGLGLAIAKSVCEQNKWKISCESSKSSTKFTVDFC